MILPVPLDAMGCYLSNPMGWHECALDQTAEAMGGDIMFGLFIGAATILVLYIAGNGGLAVPSVVTILIGGLGISVLPVQYQGTALVIIFLGLAAMLMAMFDKYVDATP